MGGTLILMKSSAAAAAAADRSHHLSPPSGGAPPPPSRISSRSLPPSKLQKSRSLFGSSHRSHFFSKWRSSIEVKLGGEGLVSEMSEAEGTFDSDSASGKMVFEPILEEGVFRFDCSGDHRVAACPSLSFVDQKAREARIAIGRYPEYIPTFECIRGQQMVNIQLPYGSSFYGTGEVSGQLERTGKRIFTWNSDAWGYGQGTTSLYQSHPWVLALLPDGKAVGVLADTTRRCEIDLREKSTIKFTATPAYPVIMFGPFETPIQVLMSLSHAIGYFLATFSHALLTLMIWTEELYFVGSKG